MARRTPAGKPAATDPLYRRIRTVLEEARAGAYRAVNQAMVDAYWHVGRLIVEHEQGGRRRAGYGDALLEELSTKLTTDFGRGFTPTNLRYMRQFYTAFPNHHALRDELRGRLSWTHYRLLLGVESEAARLWYLEEAAAQQWSTRQLERQIGVLYYERLLASRKKTPVRREARAKMAALTPEQVIRDPYVLEFLDLKDYPALRESALEQAIRNIGPTDDKITFRTTIQEIADRLADPQVRLSSFIVSNTSAATMEQLWGISKDEMNGLDILFQLEDKNTYIETILSRARNVDWF